MTPLWVIRDTQKSALTLLSMQVHIKLYWKLTSINTKKGKRMWDITQALGIPTLFIRYNPDSYMTSDEIQNDSNNKERTHKLLSCIRDAIHSQPAGELQFLRATY